jgi:hypothetical protein
MNETLPLQKSLKYVAHVTVLSLWLTGGSVLTVLQLWQSHGLGETINYWLWFAGYAGVTTLAMRPLRSGVAALITHAAFVLVLNLIPTSHPWSMLRAGYDLLLAH